MAAGVHASTVSRALNPDTRGRLSAPVVARVLETADRLGYRINAVAASLRTRRSLAVGVLVPDITNPVFPPILLGIEDALREHGYISVVVNTGNDPERSRGAVEQLAARQMDGLILATAQRREPLIDLCLSRGLPLVFVNRRDDSGRVSAVVNDDGAGIRLATRHLVSLGHRRIGFLGGPQSLSTGFDRRRGFEAAMAAEGAAAEPAGMVEAKAYSREAGWRAANRLLAEGPLTAIVTGNDLLALGCYDALREAGLSCPGDVSVTGFNDMPLVDLVAPPLTTVRIRHHQIGADAVRVLLDIIEHRGRRDAADIVLEPSLVVRGSTAPPRKG